MRKEKFNGKIDHKKVKVIVKEKPTGEKMYFAKPKDFDIATPDFREKLDIRENKIIHSVHQDSSDGKCYREMKNPSYIGSGNFASGLTFIGELNSNNEISNRNIDVAVLPMKKTADRFTIDNSYNGCYIEMPTKEWCIFAIGKWGSWRKKTPKINH